jgi:hypothetical protein
VYLRNDLHTLVYSDSIHILLVLLLAGCPDLWNQLDDLLSSVVDSGQGLGVVDGRNQGAVGIEFISFISLPDEAMTTSRRHALAWRG